MRHHAPADRDCDLARQLPHLDRCGGPGVTKRLRAEDEAQRSERTYRLLFENNPLPMWMYDFETLAFLEVNDAAVAHYGFSREEFLSMTIKDIRPPADLPALLESAANTDTLDHSGPWRHLKKDGSVIEVEINSHTITFRDRRARFVQAEDVTERARLERHLRQSQRLESLGNLAGGVAHDFNNLLAVILNYASFVEEEAATAARMNEGERWEAVHRDVEEIERAAERAARLTRQLLAFARREPVRPQVLSLNAVVSDVEKLLGRTIGEHVELVTSLAPEVWPTLADTGQMEQVLVNLAVNARDAMPSGGTLTIDTENIEVDEDYAAGRVDLRSGRYVRLRVSDTGTGIERDVLEHVFEPFFTTKPKGEGTGLGLATVYGIIKQAGGHAQIYSEVGMGTTFSALLPATENISSADEQATMILRGGRHETVLVVEDEDALREVTRRILTRNGYQVIAAASGSEAIALATKHPGEIDLLLTDVIMPQMLGKEVAERVAALRPGLRVLYTSGYAQSVLDSKGRLEAGVALLEKPFTESMLLTKLREVLEA